MTIVLAIMLLLLTVGCTERFLADFETDELGALPDSTPSGMPSDFIDVVIGTPTNDDPAATLSVEAAPTGSEESQALTFTFGGDNFHRADFLSDRMGQDDTLLIVQWDQVMAAPGVAEIFLTGEIPTSSSFPNCRIATLRTALGVSCRTDDGETFDEMEVIDFTPFELHTVRLSINRASNTTAVAVIQDGEGAATGSLQGGPVVPENGRLTAQITLLGPTGQGSYAIDRFTVTELN